MATDVDFLFPAKGAEPRPDAGPDVDFLFPQKAAGAPTEPTTFGKGVRAGVLQTRALGHGAAAAGAVALGADEFAQDRIDEYQRLMEEAGAFAPDVAKVEDIGTLGEFFSWSAYHLGEQVPNIAGFALSGGMGALVGKLAAKKIVKGLTEEQIRSVARKSAAGTMFGFAAAQEGGGIFGEQIEAELPLEPGAAIVGGAIAGMFEVLPAYTVARAFGFGKEFTSRFWQNVMALPRKQRALALGGLIGTQEAGTEVMQELVALTARDVVDENYEMLGPEGRSRMLNAAAGGLLVGGTVGAGTGVVARQGQPPQEKSGLDEIGQTEGREATPEAATDEPFEPAFGRVRDTYVDMTEQPPPGRAELLFSGPAAIGEQMGALGVSGAEVLESGPFLPQPIQFDFIGGERGPAEVVDEMPPSAQQLAESQQELPFGQTQRVPYQPAMGGAMVIGADGTMDFAKDGDERLISVPTEEQQLRTAMRGLGNMPYRRPGVIQEVTAYRPRVESGVKVQTEEAEIAQPEAAKMRKAKWKYVPTAPKKAVTAEEADAMEQADAAVGERMREMGIELEGLAPARRKRLFQLLEKQEMGEISTGEAALLDKLLAVGARESEVKRRQMTDAERQQLEADVADGVRVEDALEQKRQGVGIPVAQAQAVADQWAKAFPKAPEVVVVPPEAYAQMPALTLQQSAESGAAGSWHPRFPDYVWVFPANAKSKAGVARTIAHESLAHHGLRRLLGDAELRRVLKLVDRDLDTRGIRKAYDTNWENTRAKWEAAGASAEQAQLEADLMVAEEYIADMASKPLKEVPLLKRIIAVVRQALRKIFPGIKFTDTEVQMMLADVGRVFRGQLIGKYSGSNSTIDTVLDDIGSLTEEGISADEVSGWKRNVRDYGTLWKTKGGRWFLTPLQMAEKFGLRPIADYVTNVERWWNTKSKIVVTASDTVDRWNKLGKGGAERVSKALMEISIDSDVEGRKFTDLEVVTKLNALGLSPEEQAMYGEITATFDQLMGRLEAGLIYDAVRKSIQGDPRAFIEAWNAVPEEDIVGRIEAAEQFVGGEAMTGVAARVNEIQQDFHKLRARNYFPRMRFGKYVVWAKATGEGAVDEYGKSVPVGRPGYFATWESYADQRADFQKMKEELRGQPYEVRMSKLDDKEFSFLGMPPMLEETIANELDPPLTPQQRQALKDIFIRVSPGRTFLRHLLKRRNVAGFSQDTMRVYASYMLNAANHIARVEHHTDMSMALGELGTLKNAVRGETYDEWQQRRRDAGVAPTVDDTQLMELSNYWNKHFDYIMNPGNDLAGWRAMGFMFYLGFSVKSAAVNLTQVPMVTYPYLASKYGDGKAVKAISKAYRDVLNHVRGKGGLTPAHAQMIERAKEEGFIDESGPTELAGISESPTLMRMMPGETRSRMLNKVSYYGTFLFRGAEMYNRRVAFEAALNLAEQNGLEGEAAFQAAKDAVQATQFEYAKWNRPEFMRGKKSVFFLFWQYMQHASYLAFGGKGKGTAMRLWMMLLMMAGIQGLPFAENIMDLYDALLKKVGGKRSSVREDIRELVKELGGHPDLAMHGVSRYLGMGPLSLFGALGFPAPAWTDVSGSLSMGRGIPGIEQMTESTRDVDHKLLSTMVEMAGPVVGVGYNFLRAAFDTNPDTWKRFERTLPLAFKHASQAARWSTGEGQKDAARAVIYDPFDSLENANKAWATIGAKMLGFQPTDLSREYELRRAINEARQYYTVRRALLMQQYGFAVLDGDREAKADARKAIKAYNQEVPHPKLRINGQELQKSIMERRRRRGRSERREPPERRFRGLGREIEALY